MITGTTGEFIYSLPVVMTVALVCSRLASMSFIPLLGYYLLRPGKPSRDRGARSKRLHRQVRRGRQSSPSQHRWKVAIGSLAFLVLEGFCFRS